MKRFSAAAILLVFLFIQACSPTQGVSKKAKQEILSQPGFLNNQFGISIYDPALGKYLYNYQGDRYFIPASNTKLFSLYAGMKYLGDSLVAIRYLERDSDILVLPGGDPTFLHPDYPAQPLLDFLKKQSKPISFSASAWQEEALGRGWSWDDYNDDYDVERSPLPIYGNVIRWEQEQQADSSFISYSIPDVNWKVNFSTQMGSKNFFVQRKMDENVYEITQGLEKHKEQQVPFVTHGLASALELLKDTIRQQVQITSSPVPRDRQLFQVIRSRPVDSMFRPMMLRSDNFFAEQTLLMVGNTVLGVMNDRKIIDTLLSTDLKDLPQRPNWVDGCGLSRMDLFTPQDFVWLLDKMNHEFGLERMKRILPSGGEGTLRSRFKQDSGYIFAKTGSLTGVIALSGFLITRKNRLLIFSVLVNNHVGGTAAVRNATEKFLLDLRKSY